LDINTPTVLGVDVGGTNIRLAIVDTQGEIGERSNQQADLSQLNGQGAAQCVLDTLSEAILPLLEKHPQITAVGIGFPGFFDNKTGLMISSPNIPGLRDFALADALHKRLRLPVHVQNDASLAALGEFRFGAVQGLSSLLHLTLGTGIGGGLILNGKMYGGDGGMAMEIGHMHIAPEGRICGCGNTGCLETYASATAVSQGYLEQSGKRLNAQQICLLAEQGNQLALTILEEAGHYLGRAIAEAVKLLDVRHVSISGGLSQAWSLLFPTLSQALEERLIPPLRGRIHVCHSALNDDAGILGAAIFAFEE